MAKTPGVVLGAMMGALLGSVGAVMAPKRKELLAEFKNQQKGWAEKAKNISENVYDELKKHWGHEETEVDMGHFVKGAVMGMLVGASSALLLTPKTGKQVRNQLKNQYQHAVDSTQKVIKSINKKPKVKRAKAAVKRTIKAAKTHRR